MHHRKIRQESVKPHPQHRNQLIPNSQSNPSYDHNNYRNQNKIQKSNLNNHNNTRNYKGSNMSSNTSHGQRSSSNNKNYNTGYTQHTGNNYSKPRSSCSHDKTSKNYDKKNNYQANNTNITDTKKRYSGQNDKNNYQSFNKNSPSKKNPTEERNLPNSNSQFKSNSNTDPRYATRKTPKSTQPNDYDHKKSYTNSHFDTNPFHPGKNPSSQPKPVLNKSRKHRNESVNTFGAAHDQAQKMIQDYNHIEKESKPYENDASIHTHNTKKTNNFSTTNRLHNSGKSEKSTKFDHSNKSNKPKESSITKSQHRSNNKDAANDYYHQDKSTERSSITKSQNRSTFKESDVTNNRQIASNTQIQQSSSRQQRKVTFEKSDTTNNHHTASNTQVQQSFSQSQRNVTFEKSDETNDRPTTSNTQVQQSFSQSQRNVIPNELDTADDNDNLDNPQIQPSLTQSQRTVTPKKSKATTNKSTTTKHSIQSSLTQSQRNVTPKKSPTTTTTNLSTTTKHPTSSSLTRSQRTSTLKESGKQTTSYRNSHQSNPRLKSIAEKTLDIIKKGGYEVNGKSVNIKSDIENCVSKTRTIKPTHYTKDWLPTGPSRGKMCSFEVVPESAFGAARKFVQLDNKKTCVLNFASATKPGGGFINGKQAQEESLSRQSALYKSLKKDSEMYDIHKIYNNDDIYTDYMIYSPDVPVFRDDKDEEKLLLDNFKADVITSAAPNKASYQKKGGKKNLKPVIENRCRKIVQCAIDNNNDVLVLGAYGCGVFGNDPKEISQAFKKILVDENYGKYFDKVVFAIPGQSSNNFRVFSSEFH